MVDTVDELLNGMRQMRIREAILVTALLKLGEPIKVTHADCYDAAAHNIDVQRERDGFLVTLKPNTEE